MRKQLGQLRGKKCGIALKPGGPGSINFTGFIGDVDDHVLTVWSHSRLDGDRRYVRVDEIQMLAPMDLDESEAH